MRMDRMIVTLALALCGLTACSSTGPMPWELGEEESMARMTAAAAVGPHHEHLARMAGDFSATMKVWMAPDSEPMEVAGTVKNTMILGGRYLQTEYHSEFMGQPFDGLGLMGYDNTSKLYKSTWIDVWFTDLPVPAVGTCSDDGRLFTLIGRMDDLTTGQPVVMRNVTRVIDDNTYVFEIHSKYPDTPEFQSVQVTYTRVR